MRLYKLHNCTIASYLQQRLRHGLSFFSVAELLLQGRDT
jgi:hypothetical protein